MDTFYHKLENILQQRLTQGWNAFNASEKRNHCKEFHDFLWRQDEYNKVHRRRVHHAPYEYAIRLIGLPFMNELIKLGLYMNSWFPAYFDILDEYPDSTVKAVKHPRGRVMQSVLFFHANQAPQKLCKINIDTVIMHSDLQGAFGFEEPKIKIIESYHPNPEKYLNLSLATEPTPDYHLMGDSWVLYYEDDLPK